MIAILFPTYLMLRRFVITINNKGVYFMKKSTQITALLLAIILLVQFTPIELKVHAATTENGLQYTTINGKVTITKCPENYEGALSIPSKIDGKSVTAIADMAFANCYTLTSVVIPDTVKTIGTYAFNGCQALKKVTLSKSIKTISDSAFSQCPALTTVTIPEGVTKIGDGAFEECTSLKTITLPFSLTKIGSYAFYKCTALTSVTVPQDVKTVEEYAFANCTNLKKVYLSFGVKRLDYASFQNCKNLTNIYMYHTILEIYDCAFKGCSKLSNVWFAGDKLDKNIIDLRDENTYLTKAKWNMECNFADIDKQPAVGVNLYGKTAKVYVTAKGKDNTYKWYYKNKGGSDYTYTSSFKGRSYSISMNSARDGRQVYCIITDSYGNTIKSDVGVLYMGTPLKITTQPKSVTVAKNKTAKTSVKANGDGLKYTWYYKNAGQKSFSKSSVTSSTYSTKMTSKSKGRQVYCVINDKYGCKTKSNTVTLKMK